jgi:hypothetical protein
MVNNSDEWIKDELLQLFHTTVDDFRKGIIDDATFKESLLRLAERYERSFVKNEPSTGQKPLF